MDGIAGRQHSAILDNLGGAYDLCLFDGDHFVDDIQGHLKCRSDGLSPINSRVPMENFLQHFDVGDETLPGCNQPLQDHLCVCLVGMCCADQVHGDIRIDDNQLRYPRSISLSIWSISAVGNASFAACRTALSLVSGSISGPPARASCRTRWTHSPTVKRSRLAKRWIADISWSGRST